MKEKQIQFSPTLTGQLRCTMGKASKWLRSLLLVKKTKEDRVKSDNQPSQLAPRIKSAPMTVPAPREKRWSFRRSTVTGRDLKAPDHVLSAPTEESLESQINQGNRAEATAARADDALTVAEATEVRAHLTSPARGRETSTVEDAAAIKIQSIFRAHLARKALRALRGLVKLQALVRGQLVRRHAAATLLCMKALLTVQARARAQSFQMIEGAQATPQRPSIYRRSPQHPQCKPSNEMDWSTEENVKHVEMDVCESRYNSKGRKSNSAADSERIVCRFAEYYGGGHAPSKAHYRQMSPAPSALTDISPRTGSGHFDEFPFTTAESSPQCFSAVSTSDATQTSFTVSQQETIPSVLHEHLFFPNYMANTESSRAKARSQSAPKQRPDSYERQSSRRRPSLEHRNIPRSIKMQRSSSHIGSTANQYHYQWSIKLDKSNISLKDSECGSTSTILTDANNCRSLAASEINRSKY